MAGEPEEAQVQLPLDAYAEGNPSIVRLPPEILHHIFVWIDPANLISISRVCRLFYNFIKGNQSLCRGIYLRIQDTPNDKSLDWEAALHDLIKLEKLFRLDKDAEKEIHQLPFVCEAVTRILNKATVPETDDGPTSRNVEWLRRLFAENDTAAQVFMQQSSLFERMKRTGFQTARLTVPRPREEHQISAKLHCLYGKPMLQSGKSRSARTYPYACSKVYDLRQYTTRTKWGPFRDDDTGRVDWEKVEAIYIVVAKTLSAHWPRAELFKGIFNTPFYGSFPNSFKFTRRAVRETGDGTVDGEGEDAVDEELEARDPYGVTGYYYRVVCFLDYSDFFHYNFSMDGLIPANVPRPPLNVGEAARLLIVKIHVTSIDPPGPDESPDWPVVQYEGVARSLDDRFEDSAISGLRGNVRTTKEGEVRWTSVSTFAGQERWRSEGVQVGGRQAARGIVGNWFDRNYDVHGPAGPTIFWKASDEEKPREALASGMSGVLIHPSWEHWPPGLANAIDVDIGTVEAGADFGVDYEIDVDEEDEDDEHVWMMNLRPILAQELPRLLESNLLGEAEIAFIRRELGLD